MSSWQVFLTEFSTVRGKGKLVFVEQQASLLFKMGSEEALRGKQRDWGRLGETGSLLEELEEGPLACRGVCLQSAFIFICILKLASGGPPDLPLH